MKECPKCHLVLNDSTSFCPNCGTPLNYSAPTHIGQPPVQQNLQPGGGYLPPQPIKPKNNNLLITVCSVAAVVICALLLFIFIGKSDDKSYDLSDDEEETEFVKSNSSNKYEWLSDRLATAADLEGKTPGDLRLMRNAIFARHGYKFKNDDLREYFGAFDWYEPKYNDVNDRLSSIEKKNIAFIQKYEGGSATSNTSQNVGSLSDVGWTDDYSDIVCYVRLSDSDVRGLSKSQLRILRNTIYARHGRKFKSADLRNYFNGFSWYSGRYDEISPNSLSDVEKHNIALIQKYE